MTSCRNDIQSDVLFKVREPVSRRQRIALNFPLTSLRDVLTKDDVIFVRVFEVTSYYRNINMLHLIKEYFFIFWRISHLVEIRRK